MKYIGPYPCLTLKFPDLATASQRQRNVSGIELDFVLDTAANTNTIQEAVAIELNLAIIGNAAPGLGAAGAIKGGDTYLLGDCQLVPDLVLFMTNLSASSLPVASPAAAGLLGTAFLDCFEGGVEFCWSADDIIDHQSFPTKETNPYVVFHATPHSCNLEGLHPVPITPLNVSQIPSIPITLNGVPMNALLDTGSPITVLNAEAARIARVAAKSVIIRNDGNKNRNPFMAALQSVQKNAEKVRAVANGDILLVAGSGKAVELIQSANPVSISALSSSYGSVAVPLADVPAVYIGDLPGLALLNGLGVSDLPAVILGMSNILTSRIVDKKFNVSLLSCLS